MANCPKCGRKLKLTDWKPNCPGCGVNMVYYGLEDRLQLEADKAEEDHSNLQKKLDRLKASFVGSPLAIIRIVLSLLPIGALMLPLCTVNYSGPFIEQTASKINVVSLYNLVSSLDFDALFTMLSSNLVGKGFLGYFVSFAAMLVSAVFVIIALFALMAACGPKGNVRNITNNSISIVLAVVSAVAFTVFTKNISATFPEFVSGTLSVGIFVYIATLLLLLAINITIAVKKPAVKYKECLIGGIPDNEYFQMKKDGKTIEEIHKAMDEAMAEK